MKYKSVTAAVIALWAAHGSASASVVTGDLPARPGENGAGVPYGFQIYAEPGVTDSFSGTVGSKAWSDPQNSPGPLGIPLGWTHTSVWAYLSIANAGTYQLTLSPNASDMVPAFSLWRGSDNHGFVAHEYAQVGVPGWVNAPGFAYLDSITLGPGPATGASAQLSMFLDAGEYTLALGGNDATTLPGHLVGYSFSVQPVPVPAAVWLLGSALAGFLPYRRKSLNS